MTQVKSGLLVLAFCWAHVRRDFVGVGKSWSELTRFVDAPRIPMDNHASERAGRGPAVARKNFYGSGSLWSGRLAAMMFSLLATLAHWKINPRPWLMWYLESRAKADGKAPADIQPFLPWNLSPERLAALVERTTSSPTTDTS
jgi:transposase